MHIDPDIINHFDVRASSYNEKTSWTNEEKWNGEACDMLVLGEEVKMLDVGAGTGSFLQFLYSRDSLPHDVVALDISERMLDQIDIKGVTKIVGSASDLPFLDGSFDRVITKQALHYVKDPEKAVSEMWRVLRPGGIAVIAQICAFSLFEHESWAKIVRLRQPLRVNFFTTADIIAISVGCGFRISRTNSIGRESNLDSWLESYDCNSEIRKEMFHLFESACGQFVKYHEVRVHGVSINYKSFMHFFQLEKPGLSL